MKKIIPLLLLTSLLFSCVSCSLSSKLNKNESEDSLASESSESLASSSEDSIAESSSIADLVVESSEGDPSSEASSFETSEESIESSVEIPISADDSTESESWIESEPESDEDTSVHIPKPIVITASDFIGKTAGEVKAKYGSDFTHDYFNGSSTMNYKDKKTAFVFGATFQSISDSYVIIGVLSYGDEKVLDDLDGAMTYGEIKSAIGNEISLSEPEHLYMAIDDIWLYSLQFEYKGLSIDFSWTANPDTNFSDTLYVSSSTIMPSIPFPDKNETPAVPDYTGLWKHTEYGDVYTVNVTEQQGDVIKVTITTIRGQAYSIADCNGTLRLTNGKGSFEFLDSFLNSGTCHISIENDIMTVSYDLNGEYINFWGITVGAGDYTKSND
ncbi:MAG: hypothetical protein E7597_00075 [Ruminococcaceae bacterium]|nr:hypothetical protein [Oscillospiraceae bacterium]